LLIIQRAEEVEELYKEFYRNVYIYTLLLLLILFISFYTNRKAKESFLERKKFNTVIQFMESAVYTVKEFKINFVNPKLLKLLGYSEEDWQVFKLLLYLNSSHLPVTLEPKKKTL
jgi:PAS domain-containing protein